MGRIWDWWYDVCQWQQRWGGLLTMTLTMVFGGIWAQSILAGYPVLLNVFLFSTIMWVFALIEWKVIFASGEWKFMWLRHLVKAQLKKHAYADTKGG